MRNFDEVEKEIRRFIALSAPAFTSSEIAEVERFIDADEYRVAFETAFYIYVEEAKGAPPEARSIAQHLAERMKLEMSKGNRKVEGA